MMGRPAKHFSTESDILANFKCGNCGFYTVHAPVDLLRDVDDYDLLTAVCYNCQEENEVGR